MSEKLDQNTIQSENITKADNPPKDKNGNILTRGYNFIKNLWNDDQKVTNNFTNIGYWENYYSGCDVAILIGDNWVDDIMTIQYTLTNNKSPIYGYMSENFDAVAKGTRIVQGQMVIAYKERGYLENILQEYDEKIGSNIILNKALLDNTVTDSESSVSVDKFGYMTTAHGSYVNRNGFDIFITFGDVYNIERGGTMEMLNNCHITSRSIVCEPSGEAIAEVYSFFGREMNSDIPRVKYSLDNTTVQATDIKSIQQSSSDAMEEKNINLAWRIPTTDTENTDTHNAENMLSEDELETHSEALEKYNIG